MKQQTPVTRYERKFVFSALDVKEVGSIIKSLPQLFSEIYHQRYVNSIYLDSPNLDNYYDSVGGASIRRKFRIRWYGKLFGKIQKPKLEIKLKEGLVSQKYSYLLSDMNLNQNFSKNTITELLSKTPISGTLTQVMHTLEPTLLNRYSRKYFISVDKNYRITVDSDLVFYTITSSNNAFIKRVKNETVTILELKYKKEHDERVEEITNLFPQRLQKSSKYTSGIDLLRLI